MKRVVVKRKATPEPPKKKMSEPKKPSPLPLRITTKYHLRRYNGTCPPWFFKQEIKDWETGRWFVIRSKEDTFAKGTKRDGYSTQEEARKALSEL